jgi:hypothetical protein
MNVARIVVLTIALSAGGVTVSLACGTDCQRPASIAPTARFQTAPTSLSSTPASRPGAATSTPFAKNTIVVK